MRIPSHILYPGMVLSLLTFSVCSSIVLVMAARSDGGAQVVPGYYEESVNWDARQVVRRESEALQWDLQLEMDRTADGVLRVFDVHAQPIVGLEGTLRLRRPQLADDVAVAALQAVEGEPGVYRFEHPEAAPGFWDVVLEGQLKEQPIHLTQRLRVR